MSIEVMESAAQKLMRYIDDAIALEAASITALQDMARDATNPEEAGLYQTHLKVSEAQKIRLEERLIALGGATKRHILKDLLNTVGAAATDLLHAAKNPQDKDARNLMQAYAMESLEVAVYEALAVASETSGDSVTAQLARGIQQEEREMASMLFEKIAPASSAAIPAA